MIEKTKLNNKSNMAAQEKKLPKRLSIFLDNKTHNKLKSFSIINGVNMSKIVKTLIDQSEIKISVRDKFTLFLERKVNQCRVNPSIFELPEETMQKIVEMREKNHTSYSEVVRALITNADLDHIAIITPTRWSGGMSINKRALTIPKNYTLMLRSTLDKKTDTKLRDFATQNKLPKSEIIRVLIDKLGSKINQKDISKCIEERNLSNKKDRIANTFYVSSKTMNKVTNMIVKYNTHYSEIITAVINKADLNNMKFRTMGQIIKDAYSKKRRTVDW